MVTISINFYINLKIMRKFLILALVITLALAKMNKIDTTCNEKSALVDHICTRVDYIQGCQIYGSKDKCKLCMDGYKLENHATCRLVKKLSFEVKVGCLQTDVNGKCINCADGFFKVQTAGFCQLGVKNCESYGQNGVCQACESDYSLIMGECKHNQMLGCQKQGQNHICLRCYEPFELFNGNCVINNCKSYYDYGCVGCECGFYLDRNHKCAPMENGCIKYTRSVCVGCAKNFRLKGGDCQIEGCLKQGFNNDADKGFFCETCKTGFTKVGQICQIQNCLELLNDSCLICKDGFSLKAGACVKSDESFVCTD